MLPQTNMGHFCKRSQERCTKTHSLPSVLLALLAFLGVFQFQNLTKIQENIMQNKSKQSIEAERKVKGLLKALFRYLIAASRLTFLKNKIPGSLIFTPSFQEFSLKSFKKIGYLFRNFDFCGPKQKQPQSYQIFDKFRFPWKTERPQ